jgi:integrase
MAIRANTEDNYECQFEIFTKYAQNLHNPRTHPLVLHQQLVQSLGAIATVHRAEGVFIGFVGWAATLRATPPKTGYHYKATTITKYMQNIKRLVEQRCGLKCGGAILPDMLILPRTLKGLANFRNEGVLERLAVAPQHLLDIAHCEGIVITPRPGQRPHIRFAESYSRAQQRYKLAMFGACCDGFLLTMRASEFTSKSLTFDSLSELSRADVGYDDATNPTRGWLFTKRYKGDRAHVWPNKVLAPAIGGRLCSMSVRLLYEELFPVPDDQQASQTPYWQLDDQTPVTRTRLQKFIQKHMARMGLDAAVYKSHSLRKGGVTAMLAAGVPHGQIQLMARWVSPNMVQLYATLESNQSANVLAALGRQTSLALQHQQKAFWSCYTTRPG